MSKPFTRNPRKTVRKNFTSEEEAKKVMNKIAKRQILRNKEAKFVDAAATVSPSTTPAVVTIFGPSQGITDTTRIGDELTVKALELRYVVTYADTTNFVRVLVVQWLGDSVNDPIATDKVLQDDVTRPWVSPYYHDLRSKFRILMDRTHSIGSGGSGVINVRRKITKGFKKKIQFEGAGTVGVGKIHLIHLSDSAAAAHPVIDYYCRTHFYD